MTRNKHFVYKEQKDKLDKNMFRNECKVMFCRYNYVLRSMMFFISYLKSTGSNLLHVCCFDT